MYVCMYVRVNPRNSGIDDASLIGHINTRGIFRLNPLVVGSGCVLKSNARLLSGAVILIILADSSLLMNGCASDDAEPFDANGTHSCHGG